MNTKQSKQKQKNQSVVSNTNGDWGECVFALRWILSHFGAVYGPNEPKFPLLTASGMPGHLARRLLFLKFKIKFIEFLILKN